MLLHVELDQQVPRAYARCRISTFLGIANINLNIILACIYYMVCWMHCAHIEICLSCNMWNEIIQK